MSQLHEQNLRALFGEAQRVCAGLQARPLKLNDAVDLERLAMLCNSISVVVEATAERASELATLLMQRAEDEGR